MFFFNYALSSTPASHCDARGGLAIVRITSRTCTALGGCAVQDCHPYCYKSNLTMAVDFVAGSDASLRGELTLSPTASAKDWHGVIYADHFQLRQ